MREEDSAFRAAGRVHPRRGDRWKATRIASIACASTTDRRDGAHFSTLRGRAYMYIHITGGKKTFPINTARGTDAWIPTKIAEWPIAAGAPPARSPFPRADSSGFLSAAAPYHRWIPHSYRNFSVSVLSSLSFSPFLLSVRVLSCVSRCTKRASSYDEIPWQLPKRSKVSRRKQPAWSYYRFVHSLLCIL